MPKKHKAFPMSIWLMSLVFATFLHVAPVFGQIPIFVSNVDVFDGVKKIESTNVLIADGKIKGVGKNLKKPDATQQIDGKGKTLLPGLIDCHTHAWNEGHLRQAAMFGVTTELDMMSMVNVARDFRSA